MENKRELSELEIFIVKTIDKRMKKIENKINKRIKELEFDMCDNCCVSPATPTRKINPKYATKKVVW